MNKRNSNVSIKATASTIIQEIKDVLFNVKEDEFTRFLDAIKNSNSIFVTGQGRSGLVARTFAMRLTHIGFKCFVVGETTTPNIDNGDLLIACSSSGKTSITCHIASLARDLDAFVVVITAHPDSELSRKSTLTIEIPAPAREIDHVFQSKYSVQFRSTLFEQACLVYLDAVILTLVRLLDREEAEMMNRHANLE